MPVQRRGRVEVEYPETFQVRGQARTRRTPGRRPGRTPQPMPTGAGSSDAALLLDALQAQQLELADVVELDPTLPPTPPSGRRAASAPRVPDRQVVSLDVAVGKEEHAVVLLEQDGMFSWQLPTSSKPAQRRGRAAGGTQRRQHFEFELFAEAPAPGAAGRRGLLSQALFASVRAYVLTFTARLAADRLMASLERHVHPSLVVMANDDPRKWTRAEDLREVDLPAGHAHVLLFVHGTFSSTVGSFGALTAYPWGQELLDGARERYDAVLGFDHPTLSVDPLTNARDLLARLRAGRRSGSLTLDIVGYSRGGLLARSLAEHVLPESDWQARIDRMVFVATPNGGTRLAEPDNWRAFIDLYTNLVAGAARGLGLVAQAPVAALVVRGLVESVGAFAKYLAVEVVEQRRVPGLAAMEPDGEFITTLNGTQAGQPSADACYWYAITSEFASQIVGGEHEPRQLPARLVLALRDGLMDQLFAAANDLVVDTPAMTSVDAHVGGFLKDTYDFGATPNVFHTTYFTRPEVAKAIARWLRITLPGKPKRRRRALTTDARPDLPAAVDTDIAIHHANEPVGVVTEALQDEDPEYVVVQRDGTPWVYAYRTDELLADVGTADARQPLGAALALREDLASPVLGVADAVAAPRLAQPGSPTLGRAVVMRGSEPLGVVEAARPASADELMTAARAPRRARSRRPASAPRPAPAAGAAPPAPTASAPNEAAGEEEAAPAAKRSSTDTAHFRAVMPDTVAVDQVATVEGVISREELAQASGAGSASAAGTIDEQRPITVQVIAKAQFEVVGEDRAQLAPPTPGAPEHFYFDVRATHAGEGEVWVVARQGPVPIVTLRLTPRVVASAADARAARPMTTDADAPTTVSDRGPANTLRIIERKLGDAVVYDYELESEDLQLLHKFTSPIITGDRQTFVQNLYKEIEDRWVSSNDDVKAFHAELRAFGAQLFDELIPDKLQALLWKHRKRLRNVMVLAEEPFIPWELVHLKAPGKPTLPRETIFLAQLGLVRWLHGSWPPPTLRIRPGKARMVVPEYAHPDWVLPEAVEEAAFLEQTLGAQGVDADANSVRKLLSKPDAFDLLHFAGHGFAESADIANATIAVGGRVEDGMFIPESLNAATVRGYARLEHRPIVVLNACQAGRLGKQLTSIGGFAEAFLSAGAGAFIGCLWSVGDAPARTFTEELYRQLLEGKTFAEASVAARERARAAGESTWLAYTVYANPRATLADVPAPADTPDARDTPADV